MNKLADIPLQYPLVKDELQLKLSPDHRIATLLFNSPQSRNAITLSIAEKLFELTQILSAPDAVHPLSFLVREGHLLLLLLRSECPDVFISGGNLKDLAVMTPENGHILTEHMRAFTYFLRNGPLVSIALLAGPAAGGGAEIALACDLRIAASNLACIHLAQTHWAVPAGWGMMSDLTSKNIFASERRRGIAVAAQEKLGPDALDARGLVDARFDKSDKPDADLQEWLQSLTDRLATCPKTLREQLIFERPAIPAAEIADFDKTLFDRYWLAAEHRRRLENFVKKNQIKRK